MTTAFGMCFNWKVLAGLAAVGVGVLAVAPGAALAVLPLLLLAACPLSMLGMMFAMRGTGSHSAESCHATQQQSVEAKHARLAAIREEEQELERELSVHPAEGGEAAAASPIPSTPAPASS